MEIKKILKNLEKELDYKRLEHTRGVEFTSAALAMAHGSDVEKARTAGLLHDCAKGYSDEKKLALCEKYSLHVSDIERTNPGLLHAKLGAYLAKKDYEIDDPEILSAIEWHTTGRPEMTMLEKIVFVADYIESSRTILPGMEEIRKLAFTDIDSAIVKILDNTLKYLGEGTKAVDPMTRNTYEYYSNLK